MAEDSVKNKHTAPDHNASNHNADADIIDAEVIAEHAAPKAAGASAKKPGMTLAAKAGWLLAFGVSAFTAGVYVAPKFDPGLVYLGLKPAAPAISGSDAQPVDLAPLRAQIDDLASALARHKEMLAQHEAAIGAAGSARDQLDAEIKTLAAAGIGSGAGANMASAPEIAAIKTEIDRVSTDIARLSALSSSADPAVSQLTGALALARAESAQLKSRLGSLEMAMKAVEAGALEASPRSRLVLSLGRLKDRALMGQPFGAELKALRVDFSALPTLDQQLIGADITTLEASGNGIEPFEALVRDFDPMASAVLKATESAEGNFLNRLFTVRRTDAGANGIDAVLLRAERALTARDIAGAVDILAALDGPALAASATWRERAAAHASVMRAFDHLISGVAQAGTSTKGSEVTP